MQGLARAHACVPRSVSLATWHCSYCTTVNTMQQVLCNTCERPRLAAAAPLVQEDPPQPSTITGQYIIRFFLLRHSLRS